MTGGKRVEWEVEKMKKRREWPIKKNILVLPFFKKTVEKDSPLVDWQGCTISKSWSLYPS